MLDIIVQQYFMIFKTLIDYDLILIALKFTIELIVLQFGTHYHYIVEATRVKQKLRPLDFG